jgi:arsenate reductase
MKSKVLFLCTGNSCRSQMAEGFLRHLSDDRFDVHSAGTHPTSVNPLAIAVMREKGIDISQQLSKNVAEYLGQPFGFVITVCDHANEQCPVFPSLSTRLHWSFDDPAAATGSDEERLPVFRRVRDEIEGRVRAFAKDARLQLKR